jgi:hypothetical protein
MSDTKSTTKSTTKSGAKKPRATAPKADPRDATIDALKDMLAQVLGAAAGAKAAVQPHQLYVGIRNVSSDTLGIPAQFGEPALSLHPTKAGLADPHAAAIINYPRWQALRRSTVYDLGLVVRDDSILGDVHAHAPADRPEELAPNHATNLVLDPHAFITEHSDEELRARVGAMTSEQSLRRLWRAVDDKITEAQQGIDRKDRKAVERAVASLPSKYQFVEKLVVERLDAINPIQRV